MISAPESMSDTPEHLLALLLTSDNIFGCTRKHTPVLKAVKTSEKHLLESEKNFRNAERVEKIVERGGAAT